MPINRLTRSAMILSLIVVNYTIFKGSFNLMNAIFIPLLLYFGMKEQDRRGIAAMTLTFMVICFLFFRQQFFFSFYYALAAYLLHLLTNKAAGTAIKAVVISGASFIGFILAIKMTDYLFMTRIETVLVNLSNGNRWIYGGIIGIEAIIAGTGLVLTSAYMDRKLLNFNKNTNTSET